MENIKIGDRVINPDVKVWSNNLLSPSGNTIGEVKEMHTFKEMPKKVFAWVKFRDYECGFSTDILEKAE